MMKILLILTVLGWSDALRVRRHKAGKHYAQHDPVQIVVNKVGYVRRKRWRCPYLVCSEMYY